MNGTQTGRQPAPTYVLYAYLVLTTFGLLVFYPMFATFLGGFKTLAELRVNPLGLPQSWDPQNYVTILMSSSYWRMLGNSMVLGVLTVAITLAAGAMAAFTLAHVKFFGREMLFNYFLLGLMFPAATAIIPLFLRIRDLGLLDSYMGVVLPQVAFGLGMTILLFRQFFRNIPKDLYEAAAMDGCGYAGQFLRVTLPLSRPILATVGIITFVGSWNSYLLPLVLLNDRSLYPWPLGIMNFVQEFSTDWHRLLAYITLTILPTVIAFALAQRHIVAGLTAGAVKG